MTTTKKKKPTKMKPEVKLPKVRQSSEKKDVGEFPLDYYSYSSLAKFSSNPILFKIKYINRDVIDSTISPVMVLGNAFHNALEVYYGGNDDVAVMKNDSDAIEEGLKTGMEFIEKYPEGFIEYNTTIDNKQKMYDKFSFAFNEYVKETKSREKQEVLSIEEQIEEKVEVEWKGQTLSLPVPLKCYTDKIIRVDGKLKIVDYKVTSSFSKPDKIDAKKILQAVQYYFCVYAKYGEEPYSMIFEEVKHTKNRDGSPQVQSYEMIFGENEQFFDFYLRFYDDVTRAINGEAVWVPNIDAFFDNEIAIISYIHRLDIEEERAKQMKEEKVSNITDLLKKKIQNANNMRKLMETAEKHFVSAKSLNYSKMKPEEKIQTKFMEYGMMLQFDSIVSGATVDLYRYTPSIGLKMSRVQSYVSDIEQVLGVSGVRILAPIPNTEYVGFEVPKKDRNFPGLPSKKLSGTKVAIGERIDGTSYNFDLTEAPHMLVAGASGAGKSVFLSSLIEQLKNSGVSLHLFDPKVVELIKYKNDANEYESDQTAILASLNKLIKTMNNRYKKMANTGARNLGEYGGSMKRKFVIIDEFGDLTAGGDFGKEIESKILKLAQKGRAAGIHLIIATQSPRVKVVTGTIKANFPTKVVFRTAKAIDSQIVIDETGAEKLLGKGDMLFVSESGKERLQAYNV